jgi:hypothetical protein
VRTFFATLALATVALVAGSCSVHEPPKPRVLELVEPPAGEDVAQIVRTEEARATRDGRRLLVYVGAKWCEPCTLFHEAAARGMGGRLGELRLLDFDSDRDEARLKAAGYVAPLIPIFALPGPDGRASGKQIEGGTKGPRAVELLTPRLMGLIDGR